MIREALIVHIEFLIEVDDLTLESMMSVDDDIAYYRKGLAKADEKLLAGYVDTPPTISTTFPHGGNRGSRVATWDRLDLTHFFDGKGLAAQRLRSQGSAHVGRMAVSGPARPRGTNTVCGVSSMLAAERVAGIDAPLWDCRSCGRGHSIRTSTRMLFSWSVTSTILPPTPFANPATSSSTSMALTPGAYWEPMRKPSSSS